MKNPCKFHFKLNSYIIEPHIVITPLSIGLSFKEKKTQSHIIEAAKGTPQKGKKNQSPNIPAKSLDVIIKWQCNAIIRLKTI